MVNISPYAFQIFNSGNYVLQIPNNSAPALLLMLVFKLKNQFKIPLSWILHYLIPDWSEDIANTTLLKKL